MGGIPGKGDCPFFRGGSQHTWPLYTRRGSMQFRYTRVVLLAVAAFAFTVGSARAADSLRDSLKSGTPELKSAGPLAFGPEGVLFIGDPQAAAIYAIDTGDNKPSTSAERPKVAGIDEKIGSLLGIEGKQ